MFGDYQSTDASRFIDEIPAELLEEIPSSFVNLQPSFSNFRMGANGRNGSYRGRVREEQPSYDYTGEDQSLPDGLKPGIKVRHAQFGLGTIISVEPLSDDTKLVVRFSSVGQKTLRAKFAKLEFAAGL